MRNGGFSILHGASGCDCSPGKHAALGRHVWEQMVSPLTGFPLSADFEPAVSTAGYEPVAAPRLGDVRPQFRVAALRLGASGRAGLAITCG